jgi:hypothetical protein
MSTYLNIVREPPYRILIYSPFTIIFPSRIILWNVDPLLGNDRKINNYTTAITRQRPTNSNRGTVFFYAVLAEIL